MLKSGKKAGRSAGTKNADMPVCRGENDIAGSRRRTLALSVETASSLVIPKRFSKNKDRTTSAIIDLKELAKPHHLLYQQPRGSSLCLPLSIAQYFNDIRLACAFFNHPVNDKNLKTVPSVAFTQGDFWRHFNVYNNGATPFLIVLWLRKMEEKGIVKRHVWRSMGYINFGQLIMSSTAERKTYTYILLCQAGCQKSGTKAINKAIGTVFPKLTKEEKEAKAKAEQEAAAKKKKNRGGKNKKKKVGAPPADGPFNFGQARNLLQKAFATVNGTREPWKGKRNLHAACLRFDDNGVPILYDPGQGVAKPLFESRAQQLSPTRKEIEEAITKVCAKLHVICRIYKLQLELEPAVISKVHEGNFTKVEL
jgi:hypothetical protein